MLKITLYEVSNTKNTTCNRQMDDAARIAKQYAGIELDVRIVKLDATDIQWTNCGQRINDRDGSQAFYCDIDPAWFERTFPNNSDITAVYLSRDLWYEHRPEQGFLQVGTTVYCGFPAFVFTLPADDTYRIGPTEMVNTLTWIFLHELSHIFFQQFMRVGDLTHPLDYQFQNLLGAIVQWREPGLIASLQVALVNALQRLVPLLQAQLANYQHMIPDDAPARLVAWAKAIQEHEGWYPGSRSQRNNNPGNLRFTGYVQGLGATGKDGSNFAIFPSADRGFAALCQFLRDAAEGKLIPYKGDPTLRQFYRVYAPANDNNQPDTYAAVVASKVGVDVDTHISQLIA